MNCNLLSPSVFGVNPFKKDTTDDNIRSTVSRNKRGKIVYDMRDCEVKMADGCNKHLSRS